MDSFGDAFRTITKETFSGIDEGSGSTWFVQGDEGFYNAIDQLSAEEASVCLGPEVSSIAPHTDHTRYYIWTTNAYLRVEKVVDDWPGSWVNLTVDEAKWAGIKRGLRDEVNTLLRFSQSARDGSKGAMIGAIANIAHAAFHLGAMRQLLKLVKAGE